MQQHIISEPEIAMPGRPCATSHVPGDPSARPHSMAAVVGVLQWSLAPRGPQGQLGDFVMADRPPQSTRAPRPPSRWLWALFCQPPLCGAAGPGAATLRSCFP